MSRVYQLSGKAILLGLLAVCASWAQDKQQDIASITLDHSIIVFEASAGYSAFELTISGPQGISKRAFEGWDMPTIDAVDSAGNVLSDGEYTFELRATPINKKNFSDADRASENRGQQAASLIATVQAGYFRVLDGQFVMADQEEPRLTTSTRRETQIVNKDDEKPTNPIDLDIPTEDQVILDDLIVDGSICVGMDCVNGESFGFDTLRLKENNLRIKFQDTSNSASFPSNDWQLTANDSSNGGANKFSIDDIDGGRTPFTIEASAPSHSLYVDDGGRIGLGTATPVVELHVVDGDSPTLRLQQDGSSGFTQQTWDVAGNETNFFVRDATNGSKLPFKIRPGAPDNSLYVNTNGNIGLNTTSPSSSLHIKETDATALLTIEDTGNGVQTMIRMMKATGTTGFPKLEYVSTPATWTVSGGITYNVALGSPAVQQMTLDQSGNLTILGSLSSAKRKTGSNVMTKNTNLMSLAELDKFIANNHHLPNMPSNEELAKAESTDLVDMQWKMMDKIEELTLYTIQQQKVIEALQKQLDAIEAAQN